MKKILSLVAMVLLILYIPSPIAGDELDDISAQLQNLKRDLDASKAATEPLERDLSRLTTQLNDIKSRITLIEKDIVQKEQEVRKGERALAVQKKMLDIRVFAYYKNVKKAELSLLNLLAAENLSVSLQNFFYQKALADQDKQSILRIVSHIKGLEDKKATLLSEKTRLAEVKGEVDKQSQFLGGEIGEAKEYQTQLSKKIANLTAQQQQLIAQKLASLNIPRSAATSLRGCSDDRDIDPGFSPRFAFFTYGVPNRTGLNQYGAKGRADAGQSAEDILRAYYDNFELKKDYDTGINITADGLGTYNIEDYTKRIYEMPADWPIEALKAQAVAARSYGLAYTNNGANPICTTQACQVAKAEEKGGRWNEAVDATRGWVMVQGGSPIKAWYSSTHGGYILSTSELPGWSSTSWTKHAIDTTTGSAGSFSDLHSNAYDKDSPWFYCDWGFRKEYNNTAWLKSNEVADIVNTVLLAKQLTDVKDKEHLYQVDKPNPAGTDTWDEEKVKSELRARGITPHSNIANISVAADFGAGKTVSISLSGDGGSANFDAKEFKDWFNLRASANIQIVGPLYNVEKR